MSEPDDETSGGKEASARPAAPAEKAPKGKRPGRPKLSEKEIDSPNFVTLALLSGVFAVTVASWGAARLACNLHPPESRPPAQQPTTRLAATAKDAAIELMYRLGLRDYAGALELAKGNLVQQIEAEQRECRNRGVACDAERERVQVMTTGVLLSQNEGSAEVRVVNHVNGKAETYRVQLERDGPIWKGLARERIP